MAGCGGSDGATGDGGLTSPPVPSDADSDPPPELQAEGAYRGTLTPEGYELTMIALENDVAWGLYRLNGLLVGFFEGAGVSSKGSFTIPDLREHDFVDGTVRAGSLSTTFFGGVSIEGDFVPDVGAQSSFTATTAALTGYVYDQPATLAAIAGRWQGFYENGSDSGPVDVAPSGTISALTVRGCSYSGSVVPRASGANVYDLTILFGPAPCALPGQQMSGIAIIVETVPGTRSLLAAAHDTTRTLGTSFAGTM
jgi:hypothetical protein